MYLICTLYIFTGESRWYETNRGGKRCLPSCSSTWTWTWTWTWTPPPNSISSFTTIPTITAMSPQTAVRSASDVFSSDPTTIGAVVIKTVSWHLWRMQRRLSNQSTPNNQPNVMLTSLQSSIAVLFNAQVCCDRIIIMSFPMNKSKEVTKDLILSQVWKKYLQFMLSLILWWVQLRHERKFKSNTKVWQKFRVSFHVLLPNIVCLQMEQVMLQTMSQISFHYIFKIFFIVYDAHEKNHLLICNVLTVLTSSHRGF